MLLLQQLLASGIRTCHATGAAGPTLWHVLNSTLLDELHMVDHLKPPAWPKNGGCTAGEVSAWPEFGVDALSFMSANEELLRSTRVPPGLPHESQTFRYWWDPVTRIWHIYTALWSGIYCAVNCAADTLGLGVRWTCSSGRHRARPLLHAT